MARHCWPLLALLVLAACVGDNTGGTPAANPGSIVIDTSVGPGQTPVDPAEAGRIFAEVCMSTLPDFRGAPKVLATGNYKQSKASGTYFDQSLNLSFKLIKDGPKPVCSMVYGAKADIATGIKAFGTSVNAVAGDRDARVELDATAGPDGLRYFSAKASAE